MSAQGVDQCMINVHYYYYYCSYRVNVVWPFSVSLFDGLSHGQYMCDGGRVLVNKDMKTSLLTVHVLAGPPFKKKGS